MAALVAGALVLAQGCAVWAFLRFVRSFGDYTESQRAFTKAILEVNENYLLMHQSHVALLEKLKQREPAQERVA